MELYVIDGGKSTGTSSHAEESPPTTKPSILLNILSRLQTDPDGALGDLFKEYGDKIFRYCYWLLRNRDEAEDATAETFVRLMKNSANIRADATFTTWLFRVARNLCIDKMRQHENFELDESLQSRENEIKQVDSDEFVGWALEELGKKNSDYVAPLILCDLQDLSANEAAKTIGISVPALKSRLYRARRVMREIILASSNDPSSNKSIEKASKPVHDLSKLGFPETTPANMARLNGKASEVITGGKTMSISPKTKAQEYFETKRQTLIELYQKKSSPKEIAEAALKEYFETLEMLCDKVRYYFNLGTGTIELSRMMFRSDGMLSNFKRDKEDNLWPNPSNHNLLITFCTNVANGSKPIPNDTSRSANESVNGKAHTSTAPAPDDHHEVSGHGSDKAALNAHKPAGSEPPTVAVPQPPIAATNQNFNISATLAGFADTLQTCFRDSRGTSYRDSVRELCSFIETTVGVPTGMISHRIFNIGTTLPGLSEHTDQDNLPKPETHNKIIAFLHNPEAIIADALQAKAKKDAEIERPRRRYNKQSEKKIPDTTLPLPQAISDHASPQNTGNLPEPIASPPPREGEILPAEATGNIIPDVTPDQSLVRQQAAGKPNVRINIISVEGSPSDVSALIAKLAASGVHILPGSSTPKP